MCLLQTRLSIESQTGLPKVKHKAKTRTMDDAGLFIKPNRKKNNWFVSHFIESHMGRFNEIVTIMIIT